MRQTKIAIAFAMLLAAAGVAVAGDDLGPAAPWGPGPHDDWGPHHEDHFERVALFLDLDAQQLEQWREAHAGRAEAARSRGEEMRRLHEQIRELALEDDADAAAVGELVIEAHRRMEAARAEREAFHEELMSILTPDQQERFEAMRELRSERRPGRRHGFGHHRRGLERGETG